ncbi:MAG: hypothetical protein UW68_C0026G0008 [Candidatus Collierbacteria bacterium GW2011_GWB1_44_6]|uniref:Uncharacterized protein n=1 Tax=Candidatus Collierbacteria bacterium GW2011_GWB1_44_6 TaxID=1618384 RepID=A0A0G1ML75_9BACT|nr:MAG: hypothetical protein UW68_C0026G0008 [Candidatus Collierbacteria bacterium GW2011_GWB1_44_6]
MSYQNDAKWSNLQKSLLFYKSQPLTSEISDKIGTIYADLANILRDESKNPEKMEQLSGQFIIGAGELKIKEMESRTENKTKFGCFPVIFIFLIIMILF